MFLSGSKEFTALIRPIAPMEIRSSMLMPVFSNLRDMYTTSRRLRSISVARAPLSPALARRISATSSSRERGGGSRSLPPM